MAMDLQGAQGAGAAGPAGSAPQGRVVDLTLENFQEVLLQGSMERPVVVDLWAPWCAPCKALGPVLEKLSAEMGFTLAKLDTEANPELAAQFRVASIPDVRVIHQGRIVDSFQGALPEAEIRKRFAQWFESELDAALRQAAELLAEGQGAQVVPFLQQLAAVNPKEHKVSLALGEALLASDRESEARAVLGAIPEIDPLHRKAKAMLELLDFSRELAQPAPAAGDAAGQLYRSGCLRAVEGDYAGAMELFLELVGSDRAYRDDIGRKALITLFGVLGARDPLTLEYRKRLNGLLFR